MKIGNREFDVNHKTYIMGILNVTPDVYKRQEDEIGGFLRWH